MLLLGLLLLIGVALLRLLVLLVSWLLVRLVLGLLLLIGVALLGLLVALALLGLLVDGLLIWLLLLRRLVSRLLIGLLRLLGVARLLGGRVALPRGRTTGAGRPVWRGRRARHASGAVSDAGPRLLLRLWHLLGGRARAVAVGLGRFDRLDRGILRLEVAARVPPLVGIYHRRPGGLRQRLPGRFSLPLGGGTELLESGVHRLRQGLTYTDFVVCVCVCVIDQLEFDDTIECGTYVSANEGRSVAISGCGSRLEEAAGTFRAGAGAGCSPESCASRLSKSASSPPADDDCGAL